MRHHRYRGFSVLVSATMLPSPIFRRPIDIPLLRPTRTFDASSARAAKEGEEGGYREEEMGPLVGKGVMFAVVTVQIESGEADEEDKGDGDRKGNLESGPGDRWGVGDCVRR